jgi:hypothetical protein
MLNEALGRDQEGCSDLTKMQDGSAKIDGIRGSGQAFAQ